MCVMTVGKQLHSHIHVHVHIHNTYTCTPVALARGNRVSISPPSMDTSPNQFFETLTGESYHLLYKSPLTDRFLLVQSHS